MVASVAGSMEQLIAHVNQTNSHYTTAFGEIKALLQGGNIPQPSGGSLPGTLEEQPIGSNGSSNKMNMSAQQIMEATKQQQQQQQNVPLNNSIGSMLQQTGIRDILGQLIQVYFASKAQPQTSGVDSLLENLQMSFKLMKSMSDMVSSLKHDWIAEEKLVHQIEKTGKKRVTVSAGEDE